MVVPSFRLELEWIYYSLQNKLRKGACSTCRKPRGPSLTSNHPGAMTAVTAQRFSLRLLSIPNVMTSLSPNSTASQALSSLGATYSMDLDVEYISGALQCAFIDQKLWQLNKHSRPAGSFSSKYRYRRSHPRTSNMSTNQK